MAATMDPENDKLARSGRENVDPDDVLDLRKRLQLKTRFHHNSQDEAADIA